MTTQIPMLQRAIDAIAVPGILIDHRVIAPGDEFNLWSDEYAAFASSAVKVKRASGAARTVARGLLLRLGQSQCAIPKDPSGMPVWPAGIVGSLAHDSEVAVAATALRRDFSSVGVDVEPAQPLDPDLPEIIATSTELERIQDDPLNGRLLFAVKEAVYKAVYPLDRLFLDHKDVEVRLAAGTATVRNGRTVAFRYCIAIHIVVQAYISA